MLDRFKAFKFDWEAEALEASRDLVFRNTFADIELALSELGEHGTRFEFECYNTSQARHRKNVLNFMRVVGNA